VAHYRDSGGNLWDAVGTFLRRYTDLCAAENVTGLANLCSDYFPLFWPAIETGLPHGTNDQERAKVKQRYLLPPPEKYERMVKEGWPQENITATLRHDVHVVVERMLTGLRDAQPRGYYCFPGDGPDPTPFGEDASIPDEELEEAIP
jgi:hypothetical protein